MSETSWSVQMCLKVGVKIKERNRQETEDRVGRASSEYCNHPNLFLIAFIYPQAKGKSKRPPYQDTRNKTSSYLALRMKNRLVSTPFYCILEGWKLFTMFTQVWWWNLQLWLWFVFWNIWSRNWRSCVLSKPLTEVYETVFIFHLWLLDVCFSSAWLIGISLLQCIEWDAQHLVVVHCLIKCQGFCDQYVNLLFK